jgi:hypothetical protein
MILKGLLTEGRQMHATTVDLQGRSHKVPGREPNHFSDADSR